MEENRKQEFVADFSKHVPRLLKHQLILEQTRRYASSNDLIPHMMEIDRSRIGTSDCTRSDNGIFPSMQRFHGAILFVDISGFTALSQKLDVESLKNHINGYFSRIIEVIERWGGDVVKFAGDALYVVWKTAAKYQSKETSYSRRSMLRDGIFSSTLASSSGSSKKANAAAQNFRKAATEATEKAIRCGLEIIEQCGNFPVYLDSKHQPASKNSHGHNVLSSIVSNIASKIITRTSLTSAENSDAVAYLNVHAGVAVGLIAGLDIGCENRWEYFIIGDPLGDVAVAEGCAEKGDVVISESAHILYHPAESELQIIGESRNGQCMGTLPCGCTAVGPNCFRVRHPPAPVEASVSISSSTHEDSVHSRTSRSKIIRKSNADVNLDNAKIFSNISMDLRAALALITPSIRKQYMMRALQEAKRSSPDSDGENTIAVQKRLEKVLPVFISTLVRRHFHLWLENVIVDNFARHVHDVARQGYFMTYDPSMESFNSILQKFIANEKQKPRPVIAERKSSVTTTAAIVPLSGLADETNELDDMFSPAILRKDDSTLQEKHELNNNIEAELRTVTVMFIKIDSFDTSLLIDTSTAKDGRKAVAVAHHHTGYDPVFGFLDRTENEHMADQIVLLKMQKCFEVLYRAIYDHGGQMRQFMVDDKGTVCIASFGLRGSVNEDNAANAMDAANAINLGLQEQNLNASIGVTTGKVYCGLVGSMMRHEFALMGPSVNLSARLMCKATMGSILCDHETMHSDRAHDFKHVGDIKAKGYDHPVPTYRQAVEGSGKGRVGSLTFSSFRPFLQKFSSHFNMSMSYDQTGNHLYPSLSVDSRAESGPMHSKLVRILKSEFIIVDHVNTFRAPALKIDDNDSTINSNSANSNNILGVSRVLRGRNEEIAQLMEFLFVDTGRDKLLFDFEAMPRLAVVVGNGGLGKTALLSAIGRKIIASAKQDPAVNVVVLRNRSNAMSSGSRQNPWKPILLEILRVVKRVIDNSAEARSSARKQKNHGKVNVRRESLQDFLIALDAIFKHLPMTLQSYKSMVVALLNFPVTLNEENEQGDEESPDVSTFDHFSNSEDTPVKPEDLKLIFTAILNFCVSYTKKIMLVMIENVQSINIDSMDVLHYLWINCRGVHFLLTTTTTFRPDISRSMSSHPGSLRGSVDSAFVLPRAMSFIEAVDSTDLFGAFTEEGRFLRLTLEPLSKEASMELAQDLVLESDDHTLESIVSSSGGNPLYIVQLTKALVEEGSQEVHEVRHSVANISAMCRRVEEIICYRLDQLDQLCQAVLKVASVAASHGKSFTPNIIAFALKKTIRQLQRGLNGSPSNGHLLHSPPPSVSTPVDGLHHSSSVHMIDPRVRDIVLQVMSTLKERNEFIHIIKPLQPESKSFDDQDATHGDDAFLGIEEIRFDTEFEFRIPTEQSTIYSLIIDEQREYFHGKVAQYFYRLRYDSMDFSAAASANTSALHESNSPLGRAPSLKSLSSKRINHAGNAMTLQWLLSCEQEIGFHAEQAKLWPLAMRAYLNVGIISRRLHNTRQYIGGFLEAYKIVKCCEQEAGDIVTPLPLSYLHVDKSEKVPHTVPGIIAQMYLTGEINENDSGIISEKLESELECVYNVFGSDPGIIILAAKLNLYLAGIYLVAFGEARLVPEIMGIAMKLSIAARVCVTGNLSTKSGIASAVDAMDDDQLVFFDSDHATSISSIEDSDLAHFVFTHFNLIQADPTFDLTLRNTWKECETFETLFESSEGAVGYDAQRILEALSKGDLTMATSRWRKARIWVNESQMLVDVLRFGQDMHIFASSVLLQHLVCANQMDMVDEILARIDYLLQLHHYSLLVFMAIIPAIQSMSLLGKWEVIGHWMQRMYREIDGTHEIMVAQVSLVRSMHQWLHSWLPLANISLPLVMDGPFVSLQKSLQHVQLSRNVGTIPEGAEDDPGGDSPLAFQEMEVAAVRKASRQEIEETQMVLRVMANMHSPGEAASSTAAARRRSIAYFSSFSAAENLYATALFFLRPDRPAVAPETLPRNSLSSTLPSALEQWTKTLPLTIARFISHCGVSVESLGIQLLAMWFIHHPLRGDCSQNEKETHHDAEVMFRSAAGHLVHFTVNFVHRVTSSNKQAAHQEKSILHAHGSEVIFTSPAPIADAIFLANLVFTVAMLQPLQLRCSLINECLLGTGTPFQLSLIKLIQDETPEGSIADNLRISCAFLFSKLESLMCFTQRSTEPVVPCP